MAIARHPAPEVLAPRLRLNASQKAVLGSFTEQGVLPADYAAIAPYFEGAAKQLAPGVVVAPSPGHTEGT